MDNLKKLDSQPSEMQQKIMMDALGSINTDPNALYRVIDATEQTLVDRAKEHNRRVKQASEKRRSLMTLAYRYRTWDRHRAFLWRLVS